MSRHLQEFDDRCQKLRDALIGSAPNPNVFNEYSLNPEDFARDFVEISANDVSYAVTDFRASLKKLDAIEKLKEPRLRSKK